MPNLTKLSIVGGAAFSILELFRIGSQNLFLNYLLGFAFAIALLYPLPWILKKKAVGCAPYLD